MESITSGEPLGYNAVQGQAMKLNRSGDLRVTQLETELADVKSENIALKNRICELELKLAQMEGVAKPRKSLNNARMTDLLVNGGFQANAVDELNAPA